MDQKPEEQKELTQEELAKGVNNSLNKIDLETTKIIDAIQDMKVFIKEEYIGRINALTELSNLKKENQRLQNEIIQLKAENEQLKAELAKIETPAKKPTAKK